jgi:mono/diheme cytochrome c family protein
MRARGVERPTFTGAELRDLIAYLSPGTSLQREGGVFVLPGRADEGRRLFAERRCVTCHRDDATPGAGPSLTARARPLSPLEFAAAMWNKVPSMAAALPPGQTVPTLQPQDMADIVAYLSAIGYFATAGSPGRGWRVLADKGCLVCHGVYGERGKTASDLTRTGGLDSTAGVMAGFWNHTIVPPPAPGGGKMPWPRLNAQETADLMSLLQAMRRATP